MCGGLGILNQYFVQVNRDKLGYTILLIPELVGAAMQILDNI